jgi:sortase A
VKSRKALGLASSAFVVAALFLFGQSAWIYGKARVAQVLLRRAWTGTVRGGKEVKPWPWADTWPVARLSVPSSRENFIVLAGASGRTLAFGPGHLDGSAQPGDEGNCVLSAHRDTQFEFLRRLDVGDALDLETRDGRRLRYRVFERRVTQKSDTSVLARTAEPTLTLVTCYPFDAIAPGGPLRYVVRAQLMGSRGVRSVPQQELPLPPPSLCRASEDESGRGLPAEALAKAGAG